MSDEIHEPKCPSCSVVGNKYIVSRESDEQSEGGDTWFYTVHCSDCGHVYGVFTKIMSVYQKNIMMP